MTYITTRKISYKKYPYLSVEVDKSAQSLIGYLHLAHPPRKIEIGDVRSVEFKFIQCLFSPDNFLTAKYKSVLQTQERVYAVISDEPVSSDREIESVLHSIIARLKKKEIGRFLTFAFQGEMLQMMVGPTLNTEPLFN